MTPWSTKCMNVQLCSVHYLQITRESFDIQVLCQIFRYRTKKCCYQNRPFFTIKTWTSFSPLWCLLAAPFIKLTILGNFLLFLFWLFQPKSRPSPSFSHRNALKNLFYNLHFQYSYSNDIHNTSKSFLITSSTQTWWYVTL